MTAAIPHGHSVPHILAARSTPHRLENELGSIIDVSCAKYLMRSREGVHAVVCDAHRHWAVTASVTAHLIPLTVNRTRRVLDRWSGRPQGPEPA